MKCENCGRNEANFVYRSSINGRTEEHHLCQACAEKLGYTRRFFDQRPSVMDSFFGNNSFFSSMPSLMGRMLESPFDDFFDEMPAIGAAPVQEVQKERKDNLMSCEDQSRFSYLRRRLFTKKTLSAPLNCGTKFTSWKKLIRKLKRPKKMIRIAIKACI